MLDSRFMGVLIVRRALDAAYYFFIETFAKANSHEIVLDRRLDNRRRAPGHVFQERRGNDRRQPPPRSWDQGDFVVVPDSNKASVASPKSQAKEPTAR